MRCIPPLKITSLNMTSSTASEPLTAAAWVSGTTYNKGDFADDTDGFIYMSLVSSNVGNQPSVSPDYWKQIGFQEDAWSNATTYALNATVSYNHRVYQSLQASNSNHVPLGSPTWWEDVGATNKWRCFDYYNNAKTYWPSPLTIVLTPGKTVNSLSLLGMEADSARIRMSSVTGGGSVYDKTLNLSTRFVQDWYTFFFTDFTTADGKVVFDLPPYLDGIITVDLTRNVGNGNVGLRSLVFGKYTYVGKAQYGAQNDALNFSTIDRNIFGDSILIPRRSVPKINLQAYTDATQVDKLRALRTTGNAVPMVWSGLDDNTANYFGALLILGIYKQFTIDLTYQDQAVSTLQLEEV